MLLPLLDSSFETRADRTCSGSDAHVSKIDTGRSTFFAESSAGTLLGEEGQYYCEKMNSIGLYPLSHTLQYM